MTPKEAKAREKRLGPCRKCGGKLRISGYSGDGHPKGLLHIIIRCNKCGDWYGGTTSKAEGDKNAT